MAAHRYWRLYVSKIAGTAASSTVTVGELTLATIAGGAQVATGGTASASSVKSTSAVNRAFDGVKSNIANGWQSNTFSNANNSQSACEYIQYDFGAGNPKDIVEIRMYLASDAGNDHPVSFVLYYSDDGLIWTRQRAWADQPAVAGQEYTYSTTPIPDGSIINRLIKDHRSRYMLAAMPQAPILHTLKRFPMFFGGPNTDGYTRANVRTPYTGFKRIAGTTTVLGNPKARRVQLYEQKSGMLLATYNTKADGAFEFKNILPGTYTVIGVDVTAEQNSVIYAHVTAVD